MQIHVVLGLNGDASVAALKGNIERTYPGDLHYAFPAKPIWLVADDARARQISEKLGIDSGEKGIAGMVTTVANYFGRANPDVWAWMQMIYERPASMPKGESPSDGNIRVEVGNTDLANAG